jgi:dCMP deaminase
MSKESTSRWDKYFHSICEVVSTKSPCLSRKIGAILVRDHSILSTGFNGPPRSIPHCGQERFEEDKYLAEILTSNKEYNDIWRIKDIHTTCPRRLLHFPSGQGIEFCPAQHAEENVISNAARLGVITYGSTLYMNSVIPCQKCFGTLINAGVKNVVINDIRAYDEHTEFLIKHSRINIRKFQL